MENILIDAGPIIALFNKKDACHRKAVEFIKTNPYRYCTTWPVITESSRMLDFSVKAQVNLLMWIERGGVHLLDVPKILCHA